MLIFLQQTINHCSLSLPRCSNFYKNINSWFGSWKVGRNPDEGSSKCSLIYYIILISSHLLPVISCKRIFRSGRSFICENGNRQTKLEGGWFRICMGNAHTISSLILTLQHNHAMNLSLRLCEENNTTFQVDCGFPSSCWSSSGGSKSFGDISCYMYIFCFISMINIQIQVYFLKDLIFY